MAVADGPVVAHRPSSRRRWVIAGACLLLLAIAALAWRLSSEAAPPTTVHVTLPASVRIPGGSPALAWPRSGEAAVEVEGLGRLGTSGGSVPVPIASVAKVMTAYLLLHEQPLAPGSEGATVTITPADVAEEKARVKLDESTLTVKAGEQLTERQLLQALLLPSANNIAALVAAHSPGGTEAFLARMNATAKALGMRSTTYTDPSGFDPGTVSTPADQLKLARAALRLPALAAVARETAADLPVAGRVANINHLVGHDGYVGVKTGSDTAAGGCLMFAKQITVAGRPLTVLGVVLGQREGPLVEAALTSARRLGDSTAGAVRLQTVLPAGTVVGSARSADGNHTALALAAPLREIGWAGQAIPVRVLPVEGLTQLAAGQRAATVAGQGAGAPVVAVLATHALGGPSLTWRVEHIF